MTGLPTLTLATTNRAKVSEIAALLDWEVVPRPTLCPEVPETGATYLENAVLKARAVSAFAKSLALADDSGLSVGSLGGRPGVYSARYAGPASSDDANIRKVLEELVDSSDRSATFLCVLVLCHPSGEMVHFEGRVDGDITRVPVGSGGFGYDPVFVPKEGDGRTFAQMTREEKAAISHRGRALRELQVFVESSAGAAFLSG